MHKTAIIVPCYNEAARLKSEQFLRKVFSSSSIRFIFVNDGSSDGTREKIESMVSSNPDHMRLINLETNQGKAEAVRRGIVEALDDDFEYIGYWDADLSTPLDAIDDLIGVLENENANIVIGSRVRLMGKNIERKALRHYLGRMFATAASLTLNLAVYDTQCGAKLFRNTDTLKKVFAKPFIVDWIFDVEVLARFELYLREDGGKTLSEILIEYPLSQWMDVGGSKIRPHYFLKAPWDLAKIIMKYSYRIYNSRKKR